MLSIELCKEILTSNGYKPTNEEVKQLRDYLYFLAHLQLEDENNKAKNNDVL